MHRNILNVIRVISESTNRTIPPAPKEIEVLERSRVSDFSVTEDNSHCIFSGKRLTIKALASKHFIAIHEGFDENTVESEGESETNEGNCVVNPQLRV